MRFVSFLCLISLFLSASGQQMFQKLYGDPNHWVDDVVAMEVTPDSGFILGGTLYDWTQSGEYRGYLVKLNQFGSVQWSKSYRYSPLDLYFYSVTVCLDGGYAVCGTMNGGQSWDGFIMKVNATGSMLWKMRLDGATNYNDYATCIRQTADSGFIVGGIIGEQNSRVDEAFLIKLSKTGGLEWYRTYGQDSMQDRLKSLQLTLDGGYIAAINQLDGSIQHGSLLKTDSAGNMIWWKRYNGTGEIQEVIQTSDSGYAMVASGSVFGPESGILKTSSAGNPQWSNGFTSVYPFNGISALDIASAPNGFIIGGRTNGFQNVLNDQDGFLIRTNPLGGLIWARIYGDPHKGHFKAVRSTPDNGFAALGTSSGWPDPNAVGDFWLVKTNYEGNTWCLDSVVTPGILPVSPSAINLQNTSPSVIYIYNPSIIAPTPATTLHVICQTSLDVPFLTRQEISIVHEMQTGIIHIHSDRRCDVKITDLMGRVVQTGVCDAGKTSMPLSILSPGIYIVSCTGSGWQYSTKIAKGYGY